MNNPRFQELKYWLCDSEVFTDDHKDYEMKCSEMCKNCVFKFKKLSDICHITKLGEQNIRNLTEIINDML
jgi:hypothetical protein